MCVRGPLIAPDQSSIVSVMRTNLVSGPIAEQEHGCGARVAVSNRTAVGAKSRPAVWSLHTARSAAKCRRLQELGADGRCCKLKRTTSGGRAEASELQAMVRGNSTPDAEIKRSARCGGKLEVRNMADRHTLLK